MREEYATDDREAECYILLSALSMREAYATDDREAGTAMVVGQTAMIPPSPSKLVPAVHPIPELT
jgi:hypothetical protein